jgi:small-conductance mechanosensitive channel
MLFILIRYEKVQLAALFSRLLLISLVLCSSTVWAQAPAVEEKHGVSTGLPVENETELARAEREVALRLEQLDNLQLIQKNLQKAIETDQAALAEAESSEDSSRQQAVLEALQVQKEDLAALAGKIRTVQLLYDQAVENYRIASERWRLYRDREIAGSAEPAGTLFKDTARRKADVTRAIYELELVQKEVASLEQRENILTARTKVLSEAVMDAEQRLREDTLSDPARRSIERRRRQLVDEQRAIEPQITETRKRLLRARAQQRILAEKARQKAVGLSQWQADIVKSVVLIALVVVLLVAVRMVVGRRIKDAQRRYYLNHSLSILTVFVVLIGLLVIFVRDLAHLATGLGVAVAGLAIALQEMISSFFAWFVIQGPRGYRVRDWIRIGDHYGEVLDIGLMVTTLGQVSAIDPRGETGGSWTGGLTVIANSAIFKQPIVNFTRGYPFVWCSLTYTVTYESDWQQAEALMLETARDKEIAATAQQARKKIESMTSDFAIRVRSTEPVVRIRAGASGIELTLRFLAHPRRRRLLMDKVNRQILDAVNRADTVDFAYRTMRTIPTPPEKKKGSNLDL